VNIILIINFLIEVHREMMNIMRSAYYKEYGEPSTMLKNRMIKVALIRKNKQARADT